MSGAPLCLSSGLSCQFPMIPNIDSCCMNNPSGLFLQTQFWDTDPPLGGNETWTIHGLWPDLCTGGFEQFCDNGRHKSPEQITHILSRASTSDEGTPSHPGLLEYITQHWLSLDSRNANLWAHEWNKHGTCISTLEAKCYDKDQEKLHPPTRFEDGDVLDYFTQAVMLYTTLPTFEFFARHGIVPSDEKTYELDHLIRAVKDSSHGEDPIIRCRNHDELSEIWYHFNTRGELRHAENLWYGNTQWHSWAPSPPHGQISNCPKTGIRYLPKKIRVPSPTHTYKTTMDPRPTATSTTVPSTRPFKGQGRLMVKVVSNDNQQDKESGGVFSPLPHEYTGCLIRKGTWYAAQSLSSCAMFTADDDVKSTEDIGYHLFTLASRFAPCSFVHFDESSHSSSQQPLTNDEMFFACSQSLPFQTILSNNATVDEQHIEMARRLTLGDEHQYIFFADETPTKNKQVRIWDDNNGGARSVQVELYWQAA